MSHEIIKGIFITRDDHVIVRHASNNVDPQIFRDEEYETLTEVLRTEGEQRLDEEILYFYFQGVWQGTDRYARAVESAIARNALNIYEVCDKCGVNEAYRREFLRHLSNYLKN